MATTIVTKNGSGAPTASDLVAGELAVDLTNKRLYTEDSGGTVLELGTNPASDVTFGDNTKAIFGAGSDLQIFHDASDSIINDNGTGSLKLQQGGSTKLEVTATGIDVTGTATMDGLSVDTAAPFMSFKESGATKLFIGESSAVGGGAGYYDFYAVTGLGQRFFTNSLERMRIDSSGNLLVGRTGASGLGILNVEGGADFTGGDVLLCRDTGSVGIGTTSQINSTKTSISASSTTNGLGIQNANDSNYLITALNSSSVEVFRVAGTGDVTNTNNSYGSLSDERLKSNIVDASSQIDDIMAVQVRSYTLDSTGETHIGVVAQELESSGMSGLVSEDKDGMKSVKYSVLYMKALKALQEAMDRIETLEAKVAALES